MAVQWSQQVVDGNSWLNLFEHPEHYGGDGEVVGWDQASKAEKLYDWESPNKLQSSS